MSQYLPPIKTPEAQIAKPFNNSKIPVNVAANIALNTNNQSGNGELAQQFETVNYNIGLPMVRVQWKGSDDRNYRVINNIRSCDRFFSTRDTNNNVSSFRSGCRVEWGNNRNGGGVGFGLNGSDMSVIMADLPNDLSTNIEISEDGIRQVLYNDLRRRNIGDLKQYFENNPNDFRYLLEWARQQHYNKFGNRFAKSLDLFVVARIAIENIEPKDKSSVLPISSPVYSSISQNPQK